METKIRGTNLEKEIEALKKALIKKNVISEADVKAEKIKKIN